jgi:hypothetical protein
MFFAHEGIVAFTLYILLYILAASKRPLSKGKNPIMAVVVLSCSKDDRGLFVVENCTMPNEYWMHQRRNLIFLRLDLCTCESDQVGETGTALSNRSAVNEACGWGCKQLYIIFIEM